LNLTPRVWKARITLPQKLEATLHLTGYGIHLLLCVLTLLYPVVLLLSKRYPDLGTLFGLMAIFNATAFAPTTFFAVAQQQLGRRWWLLLPVILFMTALGAGMMLNTTRAALRILWKPHQVFERTPKFGIVHKNQDWTHRRYQLRLDRIVYFEFILALWNLGTIILAVSAGNWLIGFYATLFCIGLLFTSGFTIAQAITVYRQHSPQTASRVAAGAK
jgi:hypothetical protein